MKRFNIQSLNWKYIVGEVILIFLGINLAIWFNNWNTTRQLNDNKAIAMEKIEEEIQNNLRALVMTRDMNKDLPKAITTVLGMYSDNYGGTVASPEEMRRFLNTYPGFFEVRDSTRVGEDLFLYDGDTSINLELAELTEIAWETTKDMGIASEFGFECLYQLENMYNVQRLVKKEINKSAEALQGKDFDRLVRVLDFISQLDAQLEEDYRRVLDSLEVCN